MEMKMRGVYIARQLSFKGVEYRVEESTVSDDFKIIYDRSVDFVSLFKIMNEKIYVIIRKNDVFYLFRFFCSG